MGMLLKVEDLTCLRGGVPILSGVSFNLSRGEVLLLRGPNGAGKTTLLRTLAGLQPPAEGRITHPEECIAYAAHADGLKATLSAEENLNFWAAVHDTPDRAEAVREALEFFNLSALARRPAQNLSAGQKRRLGLARLLVVNRPLWLLDEPTVSLDVQSTAIFVRALERHCTQGGAALIATHIEIGHEAARVLDISDMRAPLDQPPPAGGGSATPFSEAVE